MLAKSDLKSINVPPQTHIFSFVWVKYRWSVLLWTHLFDLPKRESLISLFFLLLATKPSKNKNLTRIPVWAKMWYANQGISWDPNSMGSLPYQINFGSIFLEMELEKCHSFMNYHFYHCIIIELGFFLGYL